DVKLHLLGGGLIGQAASLGGQMCTSAPELAHRARALLTEALPILYGGYRLPLASVRMTSAIAAGSTIIGWLVAATLALMIARLAMIEFARLQGSRPKMQEERELPASPPERESLRRAPADDGFGAYLAWVGLFTA